MATLKHTIYIMVTGYPELFPHRVAALDHLFCVIGNGYDWKKGQLVYYKREKVRKYAPQLPSIFEEFITNDKLPPEISNLPIVQNILKKHEQALETVKNAKKIATPFYYAGVPKDYKFYPWDKDYSTIFNLPEDITPDWLEGVNETKKLLKKYGK